MKLFVIIFSIMDYEEYSEFKMTLTTTIYGYLPPNYITLTTDQYGE